MTDWRRAIKRALIAALVLVIVTAIILALVDLGYRGFYTATFFTLRVNFIRLFFAVVFALMAGVVFYTTAYASGEADGRRAEREESQAAAEEREGAA